MDAHTKSFSLSHPKVKRSCPCSSSTMAAILLLVFALILCFLDNTPKFCSASAPASAFMTNGRFGKRFSPFLSAFDNDLWPSNAGNGGQQQQHAAEQQPDFVDLAKRAAPAAFVINGRYGKRSGGGGYSGGGYGSGSNAVAAASQNNIECRFTGISKLFYCDEGLDEE